MNVAAQHPMRARGRRCFAGAGYTIMELMLAASISLLVLGAAYSFLFFALRALAGVSSQTVLNQKAGNALGFIQKRVRFATYLSADNSGNILTLGFDDDCSVDLDGDGKTYDDKNHYEQFKFVGINSTNVSDCATNQLVYISNTNTSGPQVLIAAGVRNLPGYKVFSITNNVITIIRFGVADPKTFRDHYQAIDLQGSSVSLNRPWTTNVIAIIP
jgi:hypothetical protein